MIEINILLFLVFCLTLASIDSIYLIISFGFIIYNFPYFIEGFLGKTTEDRFYFIFCFALF